MTKLQIFLFSTACRPALQPTQPPIQWALWVIYPGEKNLGFEADNSTPSTFEVKNEWSYISTPSICSHDLQGKILFSFTGLVLLYKKRTVSWNITLSDTVK
jgi:hypothetical protein